MAATLLVCPKCAKRFPAVSPRARCPHCGAEAAGRSRGDVPVARPYAPPPADAPANRRGVLVALVGTGVVLLVCAAVVVALAVAAGRGKPAPVAPASPRDTTPAEKAPPARPAEVVRGGVEDDLGTPPAPKRDPADPAPPPTSLTEAEQQEVNKAIERGLEYLKKHAPAGQVADNQMFGLYPLVGLTLLECGVPADDIVVANLAKWVRGATPKMTKTYSLSLTILFLDKLGDAQDEPLIRRLAARLIAGQDEAGGWAYDCPAVTEAEGERFLTYLDTHPLNVSATGPAEPQVIRPGEPARGDTGRPAKSVSRGELAPVVRDRPVVTFDPSKQMPQWAKSDNSNTQFGVLGVWAAKRHGVPVGRSVALISARFRRSQNTDGSWGYEYNSKRWRDSMTCAGLLGLAVARAEGSEQPAEKDPAISRGLQFLGKKVGKPGGVKKPGRGRPNTVHIGADAHGDLYFLWSLERVGVIYSLPTIGGKDWYAWGAELLIEAQNDNGSWVGGQGEVVDTCFALLFLRRVNVAKDLTRQLQQLGRIRDPDQ